MTESFPRPLGARKILNLRKFSTNCLKFDTTLHSSTQVFLEYIFLTEKLL